MSTTSSELIPSPLQSAMRLGIGLGLFFLGKYVLLMYALQIPFLGLIYAVLTLAVPFLVHRLTRSYRDQYFEGKPFPMMLGWSHVTSLYVFASLIVMPLQYYFYEYQLGDQLLYLQQSLEGIRAESPEAYDTLTTLYGGNPIQTISDALSQVSVWRLLVQGFSNSVFFGGMFGLVSAFALRRQ